MEYERVSCCLSIPCPGAYPVTVLIAILPVPSLVSNGIKDLFFQQNSIPFSKIKKAEILFYNLPANLAKFRSINLSLQEFADGFFVYTL